jgi:hypothetical protein
MGSGSDRSRWWHGGGFGQSSEVLDGMLFVVDEVLAVPDIRAFGTN